MLILIFLPLNGHWKHRCTARQHLHLCTAHPISFATRIIPQWAICGGISEHTRPAWSPDSRAIAYLSSEAFGFYGLYIYRFDNNMQGPINESVSGAQMVWSRDGQRLFLFPGRIIKFILPI